MNFQDYMRESLELFRKRGVKIDVLIHGNRYYDAYVHKIGDDFAEFILRGRASLILRFDGIYGWEITRKEELKKLENSDDKMSE